MKKALPSTKSPAGKASDYQSRIPYLLGAISNRTGATGSRFYRDQFGVGLAEGRLIYVLGYEGVLTARRASEIMGIDKGATSRALAGLQRRGLVQLTVDDADTRQRTIQFTKAGRALYDQLIVASLAREKALLSVFSKKEVQMLAALLKRLHAHVASRGAPKSGTGVVHPPAP